MPSRCCFQKNFYLEEKESKKQKEVHDVYACFGNHQNVNNQIQYGDH